MSRPSPIRVSANRSPSADIQCIQCSRRTAPRLGSPPLRSTSRPLPSHAIARSRNPSVTSLIGVSVLKTRYLRALDAGEPAFSVGAGRVPVISPMTLRCPHRPVLLDASVIHTYAPSQQLRELRKDLMLQRVRRVRR